MTATGTDALRRLVAARTALLLDEHFWGHPALLLRLEADETTRWRTARTGTRGAATGETR